MKQNLCVTEKQLTVADNPDRDRLTLVDRVKWPDKCRFDRRTKSSALPSAPKKKISCLFPCGRYPFVVDKAPALVPDTCLGQGSVDPNLHLLVVDVTSI